MEQGVRSITLPAGEDMTNSVGEPVKINSLGRVEKTEAMTDVCIGVVTVAPGNSAQGSAVSVATFGGVWSAKAVGSIGIGSIIGPSGTKGKVGGVANINAIGTLGTGLGVAITATTAADQFVTFVAFPVSKAN